jgi:ketosteroid isomerase-like protein
MSDAQTNKQLVVTWLATLGESPEKAAEGITRDFRWVCPRSATTMFEGLPREQRGVEGLRRLLELDVVLYQSGHHGKNDVHFLIAEGDRVVMQQDFETIAKNGRPYRNTYCFTFRVEGDKIAEVWEHADTLHTKQVCLD